MSEFKINERRLTIWTTDAVMKTLKFAIESVLVSGATTVDERGALAGGLVESPLVDPVLASTSFGG